MRCCPRCGGQAAHGLDIDDPTSWVCLQCGNYFGGRPTVPTLEEQPDYTSYVDASRYRLEYVLIGTAASA